MPSTYGNRELIQDNTPVVIPNNQTNVDVSNMPSSGPVFRLSGLDSRDMFIVAECSGVTGGAGILKLQQCHRSGGTFTDVAGASVIITGNGTFTIEINRELGVASALLPYLKVVATTGAGDTLTVDALFKTVRD